MFAFFEWFCDRKNIWVSNCVCLFMQRPEGIRRIQSRAESCFRGSGDYIYRPHRTYLQRPGQNHPKLLLDGGSDAQVSPTLTEASCWCSCKEQQDGWQRAIVLSLVLGQNTARTNSSKKFFHGRTCLKWSRFLSVSFSMRSLQKPHLYTDER